MPGQYYRIKNTELFKNQRYRIIFTATLNLIINILYAVGNLALGVFEHSYWFITTGAYYVILAVMRFSAVLFERKNKAEKNFEAEVFVERFSGIMLIGLSFVLCGSVYLSVMFDVASSVHEIIMITIATYTFTKITLAIIKFVKIKKLNSPLLATLRNITLCDAAVSIYSMQKSMLVSFEGMTAEEIRLMNTLTGIGVCLVVAVLGILMIIKKENENGKIKNCRKSSRRLQKDRRRRG